MPIGTIPEELFVGRAAELEHLDQALELTASKHGRMDMLVGEPGIGKTRLAEELCARARARGIRVLTGRCVEDAGAPPYWPWAQALEPYLESLKPRDLSATLGAGAPLLALMIPAIDHLLPGLKPPGVAKGEPEGLRFRLLDAAASLLSRITAAKPLLILIDDLHWADEGTLRLLVAVSRQISRCHLMLVGTYRDVELDRKHPLARVLGDLTREPLFERHALGGLSEPAVREYCARALTGPASDELPRAVHAMTEGNPLFVVEMVRELAHAGALLRLPEGIREIIGRRLDRLSRACNTVLGVAAVMGVELAERELAKAVEDATAADVLGAIDEARRARLLEEVSDKPGRYRFTHTLVRETLLAELSLRERVRIHARVATVLEEASGDEAPAHAAELLGHFEQAESILGPDKLAHYALLSAEQAIAAYAFEDAAGFARRGLAALKGRPMDDVQAALNVALAKGIAGPNHHDTRAIAPFRKAFDYYRASGDAARAVGLAFVHCDYLAEAGVTEICRDALPLVPEESLEAGHLLARMGYSLAFEGTDDAEGVAALGKALAIAEAHGDTALNVQVLNSWASIDWFYLRVSDREDKARRILQLASALDDPSTECRAHGILAESARRAGRLAEAQKHVRAMHRIAERTGDRRMEAYVRTGECSTACCNGDWETARHLTDLLLRDSPDEYGPLCSRANTEYQTGNYAQGRRYLERLVEAAGKQARPSSIPAAAAVAAIARAAYWSGKLDLGPEARSLGQALLSDSPNPSLAGWTQGSLGLIAALQGDAEEVHAHYDKTLGMRGQAADFFDADYLGFLARSFGDLDKAVVHLRHAHDHLAHEPPRYGWVCYELGRTLLEAGAPESDEEARALLEEALGVARKLGMPPLEERVTRVLAELEPRAAPLPAGLSAREAEVLRLLAKGKTNKQIASLLFISEKTVINHVSHLFAKTGATNRVEAAAFATRHGLTAG